jgi:hypothetical protein
MGKRRTAGAGLALVLGVTLSMVPSSGASAAPPEGTRYATAVAVDALLYTAPSSINIGTTATAYVTSPDLAGPFEAVGEGLVTFYAGDKVVCSAHPIPQYIIGQSDDGKASCKIPPAMLLPAILAGGVTARYFGTDRYAGSVGANGGLIRF